MLSFTGWSFVGNFGFAAKDYGVNIILNIFCGPVVNAARGIAYQVMSAVSGFVSNFQTAMYPQIVKRYATGEISSMISLVKNGSRYSFYLLAIIVIPLYIKADYVLNLWLSDVPELTVQFLRLALIMALINSMFGPLVAAIQATGKIKVFQITITSIMFLDLPLSYFLLKSGVQPYCVMYIAISTAFIGLLARGYILYRLIRFDFGEFIRIILSNIIIAVLIYYPVSFISKYVSNTIMGLILVCFLSVCLSLLVIYVNLKPNEKEFVKKKVYSVFNHL